MPAQKTIMIELNILNETDPLEAVVLGTAKSTGPMPHLEDAYDPKSKHFISSGGYPKEEDMVAEMESFAAILERYGVKVFRPEILKDVNQIFARDISFVIGDRFVVPNILKKREAEISAIQYIVDQVDATKVLHMPEGARAEGGDVMPWNGNIFVG